jgi:hypothetical protein
MCIDCTLSQIAQSCGDDNREAGYYTLITTKTSTP